VLKFLLAAATFGAMLGGGGGTLAASLHHSSHQTKVARVGIALGKPGKTNRLTVPSVAVAAGDRMQRPFDLKNSGATTLQMVAMTTTASPSSRLDTDPVNGLQLQIDRCVNPWKQIKKTPQYSCNKPITSVVAPRPVIGTGIALSGLAGLAQHKVAHLLLTLSLPTAAPNTLQGQTTALTYTFTAI